jgi:protein-disulfide isomerase
MSKDGMSKRQVIREQRRRAQQRSRIILYAGVALVAIAVAAFLIVPQMAPVGKIATIEPIARPQAADNAAGDPDAPIKIVEYSDFQCPYCGLFTKQTEGQLMDAYVATGQVYFVYRSYGAWIGKESADAAAAAYCAGDQGKFWEMHDMIFANQTGENVGDFTPKRLVAFAGMLGLDMGEFNSCFNGNKYADRIQQDAQDAQASNIRATPSFVMTYVVNGETRTEVIEGAESFATFQSKIDAALAEIGQ